MTLGAISMIVTLMPRWVAFRHLEADIPAADDDHMFWRSGDHKVLERQGVADPAQQEHSRQVETGDRRADRAAPVATTNLS